MRVMLIGNPNCGKTTLFNALTGDNQRVGNWPGVTVEQKTGAFQIEAQCTVELIDLPGLYSLTAIHQHVSQDEKITAQAVVGDVDVILNVIDACHLERHLYLTSQLLELGKPVVLALNMMDIAQQRGITIDVNRLSTELGCAVVPIQAHRDVGIDALKQSLLTATSLSVPMKLMLPQPLQKALMTIQQYWLERGVYVSQQAFYWANRLLECDVALIADVDVKPFIPPESDILMADARYQMVHDMVGRVQKKRSDTSDNLTAKIDRIVLHRVWALPIFLGVMYLMFFLAINVGGALQDFFDIASDAIFVQGLASLLQMIDTPQWLIALTANGFGKGINTTLTFIPVIASMFFFLALLETSGYMARAAFVVDKAMRMLGLPGKSFVPMIVGFGCNVPAIMAARTLDSERDRLLTVLMSPFMSCSARLAIYAIFVAAFFPVGGQNVVFSLYVTGVLMAVLTGFLLRKTVFKGSASPLLLELPAYHKPSFKRLYKETSIRLRYFIVRAGQFIVPVCVILGGLNALSVGHSGESVLSIVGKWMTPLFSPMGIAEDNWPATMGLLTGMLAKEVVVGTLHTLYAQTAHIVPVSGAGFDFWATMQSAFLSIPQNILNLAQAIVHPLSAHLDETVLPSGVSQVMLQHFDGQVGAYAYLLFVLLYIPCVSTMAVIRQEAGRRFMWFSLIWSLILAYGVAVGFYQLATMTMHVEQTIRWIGGILVGMGVVMLMMRKILAGASVNDAIASS